MFSLMEIDENFERFPWKMHIVIYNFDIYIPIVEICVRNNNVRFAIWIGR